MNLIWIGSSRIRSRSCAFSPACRRAHSIILRRRPRHATPELVGALPPVSAGLRATATAGTPALREAIAAWR
jgi:hypothetical protein